MNSSACRSGILDHHRHGILAVVAAQAGIQGPQGTDDECVIATAAMGADLSMVQVFFQGQTVVAAAQFDVEQFDLNEIHRTDGQAFQRADIATAAQDASQRRVAGRQVDIEGVDDATLVAPADAQLGARPENPGGIGTHTQVDAQELLVVEDLDRVLAVPHVQLDVHVRGVIHAEAVFRATQNDPHLAKAGQVENSADTGARHQSVPVGTAIKGEETWHAAGKFRGVAGLPAADQFELRGDTDQLFPCQCPPP